MPTIHQINANELNKLLTENNAVLLDVREVSEYQTESIPGSKNIPLSQVTIDEAHLPEHKNKKIVIHCQGGKRSMMACEKLLNDNCNCDLYNLEGGIIAWKQANLPTKKASENRIPLQRQVSIAIGSLSLIGVIFSLLFNNLWLILTMIASIGLINSGITGWCGLQKIISKMPWNN